MEQETEDSFGLPVVNGFLMVELGRTHSSPSRTTTFFKFYLNREVISTETNKVSEADRCLAKNCQQPGHEDGRAVPS